MIGDISQGDCTPRPAFEESAEELYEMAPCGYLTTATDGTIVKANRTLHEWLGYEIGELALAKRFVDLLTVGGRIYYDTHFSLLLRMQSTVYEIALDLRCKDGRILPALINARQQRSSSGDPLLNRFTIFNATERRQYEGRLLAARDLFRTTLSSIADGVVATDAEGCVTFMNPEAERLSGWSENEALGKGIEEVVVLVREDNAEAIENPIRHSLRTGSTVCLANHTLLLTRDGRRVVVDDSASPIRDDDGHIGGSVIVFRDVTARREAEMALAEANRLLALNATDLKRSNEDLSQFAWVASHDLRSPLRTVMQYSAMIERDYGAQLGQGKELLAFVKDAATRMTSLIDDLLTYAQASSDAPDSAEVVDANLCLAGALQNLRSFIDESGATITHEALPLVRIPGSRLTQVFQNLIGNAIHYRAQASPRIHVAVAEAGNCWRLSCQDNGIGIAAEHQTGIFEPFQRLHGFERPGSGIGLTVCRKIIDRQGGGIWVESQPGRGSIFFFTLPKAAQSSASPHS